MRLPISTGWSLSNAGRRPIGRGEGLREMSRLSLWGEIEDVPLLVKEEEIEVSCVFLGVSDRLQASSIFLPGRRSGSWSDLLPRTVPWSWHLPRQGRGPRGTGCVGSSGEVADHLQVDEAVMMTKRFLYLYSQKAQAY